MSIIIVVVALEFLVLNLNRNQQRQIPINIRKVRQLHVQCKKIWKICSQNYICVEFVAETLTLFSTKEKEQANEMNVHKQQQASHENCETSIHE